MIAKPQTRRQSKGNFEGPSPAMIQRLTATIQKHWSTRTRLRRAVQAEELVGLVEIPSVPRRKGFTVD